MRTPPPVTTGRRRGGAAARLLGAVLLPLWFASAVPAQGTWNPEQTLTTATATDVALRVFDASLIYVATIEADQVVVRHGPDFSRSPASPLGTPGIAQRHPALAVSLVGGVTVFYQEDGPAGQGPEIRYRASSGGGFSPPVTLSPDPLPDVAPSGTSQRGFGNRDVAWTRSGAGSSEIRVSLDLAPSSGVATGEEPALDTFDGITHELAYRQAGGIHHRARTGGAWGAETTISGGLASPVAPQVACDATGAVHVLFLAQGKAWYVRRPAGGGFTAPIELSPGVTDVAEAELSVLPSGIVHVYYLSTGDIWRRAGAAGIFGVVENLTGTPADPEDTLAAELDPLGHTHLLYRRGGALRYRNDVPPPVAGFAVSPQNGESPLPVAFTDLSAGVIDTWEWSFGDGASGSVPDPEHTYLQVGSFAVTLMVSGPGGSDTVTIANAVGVAAPSNVLRIPSITVIQGQPDVTIAVLGTHTDPLQGYQNGLVWDPAVLAFESATITGTACEAVSPEFLAINPLNGPSGVEGLTMGVVIDTIPPFDGRTLPPGTEQRLLHLRFDIPFTTPPNQTTWIQFDDTIGEPPILNVFIYDGQSLAPLQIDGSILVMPFVFPPPLGFLRGDVDAAQGIGIADAVQLLTFLFAGGSPPWCMDAGDVNDSGSVDLSDPIRLLNFLFLGGNPPPYPWPVGGYDPTPDSLGPC